MAFPGKSALDLLILKGAFPLSPDSVSLKNPEIILSYLCDSAVRLPENHREDCLTLSSVFAIGEGHCEMMNPMMPLL